MPVSPWLCRENAPPFFTALFCLSSLPYTRQSEPLLYRKPPLFWAVLPSALTLFSLARDAEYRPIAPPFTPLLLPVKLAPFTSSRPPEL